MKTNFENPTEGQKELIRYWMERYRSDVPNAFTGIGDNFIEKHLSPKPKIEVGKWYKANNPESKFLVFIESFEEPDIENNSVKSYGFSRTGFWMDSELRCPMFLSGHCIEVTEQEVTDRLIEEAKKRGYHKTVDNFDSFEFIKGDLYMRYAENQHFVYSTCIMRNGKWAEIINTELEDAIKALDDATEKLKNLLK
jgi:hypothetical protein